MRWPTRSPQAGSRGRRSSRSISRRGRRRTRSRANSLREISKPQSIVNNAGFGLIGRAAELDRAEQLAMIDLNVRALTDLSLAFVDSLARHKGGILNVASLASFLPAPGMAVYYATKAYVLSFSEALHVELRKKGVRVTALCPGPVPTEFQARAGLDGAAARRPARIVGRRSRRGRLPRICRRQAAGRAGTAEQARAADAADFPARADPDGVRRSGRSGAKPDVPARPSPSRRLMAAALPPRL